MSTATHRLTIQIEVTRDTDLMAFAGMSARLDDATSDLWRLARDTTTYGADQNLRTPGPLTGVVKQPAASTYRCTWRFERLDVANRQAEARALLDMAQDLYRQIAVGTWPEGGTLYCHTCGGLSLFTVDGAAHFLAQGWPICCGETMHFAPRPTVGSERRSI
jgi:hypothetical protein